MILASYCHSLTDTHADRDSDTKHRSESSITDSDRSRESETVA